MRDIDTTSPSDHDDITFDLIWDEHHTAIERLAYLLVRSRPVAEELTQEAFLRLFVAFGTIENPPGFLRTVVIRLASTWRSRSHMETDRIERFPMTGPSSPTELDETWEAIGRLRPERATVLVLRFYEDLSHRQIAGLLQCPTSTVRSRVRRALNDLRKELEP